MMNEKIEDGEKILKEKCYVHPKRDPNIFSNDLAIIKLASDIIFSERVKPICIGDPSHKINVLAAGWGQQGEKGGGSVTLKYVWLDVISPGECRARIQTAVDTQPGFKGRFTSNTICTWEEAEDTCGGDSGGPLVTRAGDSLELVGLTSWGPRSCANSQEPGVFTDVRKHLDWIKRIIEGSDDVKGGNRQISDQLSSHHETTNERIYNRNPEPVDKKSGHGGYKQKQHNYFDEVIVEKLKDG